MRGFDWFAEGKFDHDRGGGGAKKEAGCAGVGSSLTLVEPRADWRGVAKKGSRLGVEELGTRRRQNLTASRPGSDGRATWVGGGWVDV